MRFAVWAWVGITVRVPQPVWAGARGATPLPRTPPCAIPAGTWKLAGSCSERGPRTRQVLCRARKVISSSSRTPIEHQSTQKPGERGKPGNPEHWRMQGRHPAAALTQEPCTADGLGRKGAIAPARPHSGGTWPALSLQPIQALHPLGIAAPQPSVGSDHTPAPPQALTLRRHGACAPPPCRWPRLTPRGPLRHCPASQGSPRQVMQHHEMWLPAQFWLPHRGLQVHLWC